MSKSVIKVQDLSKRYRLGLKEKQSETLAGQIANVIKSPWQNLKRLKDLNRFREDDESVFWALKGVSFEVKEGEVLGIIGKNGAGKSTLLKILSQITEPTSGKIEIHGRVASLLEVGTGFHPELSGRENIYMNGTILGMTRREIDSKLDEIIDFSGVEKFIDTPVKFYSSGMKVRLGFSVAAHLDPEILIIDEVLAVGDYEFQAKCLGKMNQISRNEGRTVLFVSHNMDAVKSLCKRIVLLRDGELIANGNPSETIEKYLLRSQLSNLNLRWPESEMPGNKTVRVKSISLTSEDSNHEYLARNKDLNFNFKFCLLENGVPLNLSLHLFSVTGECIMNVFSQIPVPTLNRGNYESFAVIPANLLNEGRYFITLMFVKNTSQVFFTMEEVLMFELVETNRPKMNWHGKIPGFIHPKIDFKIISV
ncbi:polysaccharide ABC transporter ATP-binding protein [uncultured Algoriphagus sp.]|uniref:ABC transporter ATP-binding protein n=1 Tax=uncultured Algoriphagus sp. TaxID=417365 RepID=UPI002594CD73|nr:polysaccharide ABC transporter ATP-binding protein [uncultured Algoriphagus sp.]